MMDTKTRMSNPILSLINPKSTSSHYLQMQGINFEEMFGQNKKSVQARKAELLKMIPVTTSKCWAIYDAGKMGFIHGKRENVKREVASLTKIMTCYVVIKLSHNWNMPIETTEVTVSQVASDIRGTSANLEAGDILTVE